MRILQHGYVASEFPMGTPPDPENFPTRNRIVSGLALGTVVVEAADKSGSLITAACALDQGREVFAVPGPVGMRSRGTHQLLRQGATLAEAAEDLMAEIAPQVLATVRRPVAPPLSAAEAAVYGAVAAEGAAIDQIISQCGLGAAQVLEVLLRLELRGLVTVQPGQRYMRAGQ
jgi:DNA processing protein